MKLKNIKIISMLIIGSGVLGLSTFARADDLKVSNNLKNDLSFSINKICSNEFGVANHHSIKIISEANFNKACSYNPGSCEAKVYNAPSCMGKQVATVVFDTSYGVQGVYPNTGIMIRGNLFNLFFEEL